MSAGNDESNEENEELARCDACGKLYKHCRCEQPEQDEEKCLSTKTDRQPRP